MYIYYILIILAIILWQILGKKNKKLYAVIMCILFTIVAGLRKYTIGNDTENYVNAFLNTVKYGSEVFDISRFEKGFVIFNLLVSKISISYTFYLMIISLIINMFICKFIYKYSKNMCASFLVFILFRNFFSEMNIMRQYISIGIIIYSIRYIEKRQFFKYMFMVIIASLFHNSAMFTIFLYFVYDLKFSRKSKFIILCISLIIYAFLYRILIELTNIIGLYGGYVEEYINSNKLGSILSFLISLVVYLFIQITRKKAILSENKTDSFLYNISFLLICMSIISIKISIFSRFEEYLQLFYIVLIPNTIETNIKNKEKSVWYLIIFICLFIYFLTITYLKSDWNSINPYKFFWQ